MLTEQEEDRITHKAIMDALLDGMADRGHIPFLLISGSANTESDILITPTSDEGTREILIHVLQGAVLLLRMGRGMDNPIDLNPAFESAHKKIERMNANAG